MKRTIRSLIVVSMLIAIALPLKVAAQQDCCFTQEQVDAAKRSRQKLKLERDKALNTADSLNKVLMQLDSVPPGSQIQQMLGGDVNITINTTPSGANVESNEAGNFSDNRSNPVKEKKSKTRTTPITLGLGLVGGNSLIGGDARVSYSNAFLDYRFAYGNEPSLYHRGMLGFISGNYGDENRFLIGLASSVNLITKPVIASTVVETGDIDLGDEIVVTTTAEGDFWSYDSYNFGLCAGMQILRGEHFWGEVLINPMFAISQTGNFQFNTDLRAGYRLNKTIFFGGLNYFNQTAAFNGGVSFTF